MKTAHTVQAAVAALIALGVASATAAPVKKPEGTEKCYGVAKAGQNDCRSSKHSCAGTSKTNNDTTDFKYLPNGSCKQAGGKLYPVDPSM